MSKTTAKIHSIETFGAVDGPGIRTVFFMQGCPARCMYCHNPDTWSCGGGSEITIDEMLRTALRGKMYYGEEGGVTFSGGEAMMQGEFLLEAIKVLHENDINVCIDTSGTWWDEYTEDVIREADMLLLDVKHSEKDMFREISGRSMVGLYRVISMANRHNTKVWIRQVVVPGINDSEENIRELADFIHKYVENLYCAELLGYHTMGKSKYENLGIKYRLEGVKAMDSQKLNKLNNLLQERIVA